MMGAGVPEWPVDALLDLMRFYREGKASTVDPTLEKLIGRPAIRFDQFARDYAGAFAEDVRAAG
jgi:hypothetical protein